MLLLVDYYPFFLFFLNKNAFISIYFVIIILLVFITLLSTMRL